MSESNALLSQDQQTALAFARQQNAKRSIPRPPEIRLHNVMMDVKGVEKGQYFINRFNSTTEENEAEPIGPSPKLLVLHRAYTYSYYDEQANRLVAWTNELTSFDEGQRVFLFCNNGEKAFIEKEGTFPEVQAYMKQKYVIQKPGGSLKNLMKFTNVLYVLYGGIDPEKNVYRMFVSNASAAGVETPESTPDFKNPQPGSLLQFWRETQNRETAAFETWCELGSKYIEGTRQFWLMTFTPKEQVSDSDLGTVVGAYQRLLNDWMLMQKADVERMAVKDLMDEASTL